MALRVMLGQFIGGLSSSFSVGSVLSALARSRTARRKIRNAFTLNAVLIAVGLAVAHRLLQAMAASLFEMATGRPAAGLAGRQTVDAIAAAALVTLAVIPLLAVSLVCTNRWSQQAAAAAWPDRRRAAPPPAPSQSPGSAAGVDALAALGDAAFQTVLILVMTVQAVVLDAVPLVGRPLALALTAVVVGFTAIDAGRWGGTQGPPVAVRLALLEASWPWYAGFGATTALASYFWSPWVNAGIYGLLSAPLALVAAGLDGDAALPSPSSSEAATAEPRLPVLLPFKWSVLALTRLLGACSSRCYARSGGQRRRAGRAPPR